MKYQGIYIFFISKNNILFFKCAINQFFLSFFVCPPHLFRLVFMNVIVSGSIYCWVSLHNLILVQV